MSPPPQAEVGLIARLIGASARRPWLVIVCVMAMSSRNARSTNEKSQEGAAAVSADMNSVIRRPPAAT